MVEKGRCQYIGEFRCKRGRVYQVEVSPGVLIWVCPSHKRVVERFNRAEEEHMKKMAAALEREDEIKVTDNVVKFEVISGGKEPPSDYWLKNLNIGTIFLAKQKPNTPGYSRTFVVGEFIIFNISPEKGMYLLSEPKQPPQPFWVDPMGFSNAMELIEVMRTNAFQTMEIKDDDSGAVRSGGHQDDAPAEGEH